MDNKNPYQTPESSVAPDTMPIKQEAARLEKMALGQKLIIYSILIYFVGAALQSTIGSLAMVLFAACLALSLAGMFLALLGSKMHVVLKVVIFLLLFVPLVNILTLLIVNRKVTETLRKGGYSVGFFGAKKTIA